MSQMDWWGEQRLAAEQAVPTRNVETTWRVTEAPSSANWGNTKIDPWEYDTNNYTLEDNLIAWSLKWGPPAILLGGLLILLIWIYLDEDNYTCKNGQCEKDDDGEFTSLKDCKDKCSTNYGELKYKYDVLGNTCKITDENNGITYSECIQKKNSQPRLYVCKNNGCIISVDGTGTSYNACKKNCNKIYKCDNNNCIDKNIYKSKNENLSDNEYRNNNCDNKCNEQEQEQEQEIEGFASGSTNNNNNITINTYDYYYDKKPNGI